MTCDIDVSSLCDVGMHGARASARAQAFRRGSELVSRAAEEFDHVLRILRAPGKILLSPPVVDGLAHVLAGDGDPRRARMYLRGVTADAVVFVERAAACRVGQL